MPTAESRLCIADLHMPEWWCFLESHVSYKEYNKDRFPPLKGRCCPAITFNLMSATESSHPLMFPMELIRCVQAHFTYIENCGRVS